MTEHVSWQWKDLLCSTECTREGERRGGLSFIGKVELPAIATYAGDEILPHANTVHEKVIK